MNNGKIPNDKRPEYFLKMDKASSNYIKLADDNKEKRRRWIQLRDLIFNNLETSLPKPYIQELKGLDLVRYTPLEVSRLKFNAEGDVDITPLYTVKQKSSMEMEEIPSVSYEEALDKRRAIPASNPRYDWLVRITPGMVMKDIAFEESKYVITFQDFQHPEITETVIITYNWRKA